jgi:hypothetical protein
MTPEDLLRALVKKHLGEDHRIEPDLMMTFSNNDGVFPAYNVFLTEKRTDGRDIGHYVGTLFLNDTTLHIRCKVSSIIDLAKASDEEIRRAFYLAGEAIDYSVKNKRSSSQENTLLDSLLVLERKDQ